MNTIKDSYEDGICPDCGEEIPDDVVEGQACENCEHAFYEYIPDPVRVWLDDVREMPEGFDIHVKTAQEAIDLISQNRVVKISFDHDLGTELTGYDVAKKIEELAFNSKISQVEWSVHSQNGVGAENIKRAMKKADEYWNRSKLSCYDECETR